MDKQHLQSVLASRVVDLPSDPESLARRERTFFRMAQDSRLDLDLDPAGHFTLAGLVAGVAVQDAGTWTQDGDGFTLSYSLRGGRPSSQLARGSVRSGALHLRPSPEAPGEFRFVRR